MRRLPWHVSVRADRKAVLTALGISVAVSFSIIGFVLASALEGESISEEGRFARPDLVVARADGATFDARALEGVELAVLLVKARTTGGEPVTLAGVEGPRAPTIDAGVAIPVTDGRTGTLELEDPRASLAWGATIQDAAFARGWALVRADDLRALVGEADGAASYAIVTSPPPAGFTAQEAPSVEPFFRSSGAEVGRDLALVVAFSSVLVALFAYEFLRTEIRSRRREIALWRSLGMRVRDVGALLLGRGTFIAAIGTALGFAIALGTLGAAATVSSSGVFRGALSPTMALALFAGFVLAGAVGALVPALDAARRPVREWLEAAE